MQIKIIKNNIISCILALVLCVSTVLFIFTESLGKTMDEQAYSQTMLLVHILQRDNIDPVKELQDIKDDIYGRITFVSTSGEVLFDSNYALTDLESHADRQEIIDAQEKGIGTNKRFSVTSGRMTYYCAAKINNVGVVRVGVMGSQLAKDVISNEMPIIMLCMCVILFIIYVFSHATTQKIVKTIEDYDIENSKSDIYPELSRYVNQIKRQNDIINSQIQNITAEKQKLHNIFMSIKEAIIVCDGEFNIIQTNNEAARLFSLSENKEFKTAVQIPEILQSADAASKGNVTTKTFRYKNSWYQVVASPYTYNSEQGVIVVVSDISEQIKNENIRRQFTDNVTHELKTPLTSILGYSQLITNDIAKEEDIKKFVKIIENNASRLLEMIDDIIKISNLETGYGIEKLWLSMDEIVDNAIKRIKPSAETRNIQIKTDIQPVEIFADEEQMYQLARNILTNAVKYNRENGSIFVKLEKSDKNVVFTVSDTGIGIDRNNLDKIFERFYVVDKSRNKNISSTGLGLAIVKHVVKAHDGTVTVNSQLGKGTTFVVTLPIQSK